MALISDAGRHSTRDPGNRIRVLHVVPSFWPATRYGGPIQTVLRLCQELSRQGVSVDVATTDCDGRLALTVPTDEFRQVQGLRVCYFRRDVRIDYAPSRTLARFLLRHAYDYDLVHITSTFSFPALMAGFAARRVKRPYVVSPRGSLQHWSLGQKRWKKAPYWQLLEKPHLKNAAAIHATAAIEAEAIRAVLPQASLVTIANGADDLVEPPAVQRHPTRIVFLGRIHKKKGFDVLVPALAQVARVMPAVETVVAGPDDEGEWPRVLARLGNVCPRPRVTYLGPVNGPAKYELLASAAVFVLPSHSENFGMSVVEALSCGTPVIVSRNCPWADVESEGAGYWIENTPEVLADRIIRVLQDPVRAAKMGRAGRRLAQRFHWPAIGAQMAHEYERIVIESRRK